MLHSPLVILISTILLFMQLVIGYKVYPNTYFNRTNFCGRAKALMSSNTSLPIVRALQGMQLLTAYTPGSALFYMNFSATGKAISGFLYNLQNEIAARGGFSFNYVPITSKGSLSYDAWLAKTVPHVDFIAGSYYSDTAARRQLGVDFSQLIVDASIVLISVQPKPPPLSQTLWSFFLPFTFDLWILIMGVIICNAILHWIVDDAASHRDKPLTLFRSLYLSFSAFTGAEDVAPAKPVAAVLNYGYGCFLLITVSTYTANLASLLISSQSAPVNIVQSIDDASTRRLSICALTGTVAASMISTSYPRIKLITIQSNVVSVMLQAMRSGACIGSVVAECDWLLAQGDIKSNPNCDLIQRGPSVRPYSGAWVSAIDYGRKCTSFASDVIDSIVVGMKADGTYQKIYKKSLQAYSTIQCPAVPTTSAVITSVGLADMGGIFILYILSIGLMLFVWTLKQLRIWLLANTTLLDRWYKDADGNLISTKSTKSDTGGPMGGGKKGKKKKRKRANPEDEADDYAPVDSDADNEPEEPEAEVGEDEAKDSVISPRVPRRPAAGLRAPRGDQGGQGSFGQPRTYGLPLPNKDVPALPRPIPLAEVANMDRVQSVDFYC